MNEEFLRSKQTVQGNQAHPVEKLFHEVLAMERKVFPLIKNKKQIVVFISDNSADLNY